MKGSIEHYVEYRLVSSEEWGENYVEEEDEINDKYSQPREEDGKNKRKKAAARGKQRRIRGGFYFEPPEFIKNSKSGCIWIDNKDEYCLKYAVACAEHFKDCSDHPRRHQHYMKYFEEHNYKRMNFPIGYNDLEKFHKDNPNTILNIYGVCRYQNIQQRKNFTRRCFLSILQHSLQKN
jgi:hypothetical protein